MTGLLEFRDKIKSIYSKNEVFILPVIKFLIAFLVLAVINGELGYMAKLDNMAIVLIVALFCSFMPTGCITLFAALFSLLHMYAMSLEAALVGFVVYMLLFLLFMRFAPKGSLIVVLTPLLCSFGMPYVMPVAVGLIGTPAAAVPVGCGVVIYYLFQTVIQSAPTISTMGADEITAKIRLLIDAMINNKTMVVMIVAFAITVIVVYLIRRMSIDYSWSIAIVAGVMTDLVILLIGDLMYDTNMSVLTAIFGAVIAIAVGKVIEFFRFCVDYSRTEKVQFEDDEYYYYVKAVPKMTVAAPTKTVKKINTQRTTASVNRNSQTEMRRNGQGVGHEGQHTTVNRSVSTERTAPSRSSVNRGQAGYNRHSINNGKSVTINSNNMAADEAGEYEDLF